MRRTARRTSRRTSRRVARRQDTLYGAEPMPLIVPANEQGAGFMGAGYARASGKVGVVMVTSGPGATNTVTPVRDCMADSTPLVVICGQVPTHAIGTDAFQEAPVNSCLGPVAKHTFLVTDPEKLEMTVRTAFEIARTGRPGPVVIDLPKDVQNWVGEFRGDGLLPVPGWNGEYEWQGYVPFENRPHLINPEQGYIATANNKVAAENYPHFISHYWEPVDRITRIRQLLNTSPKKLSVEDVEQMQQEAAMEDDEE